MSSKSSCQQNILSLTSIILNISWPVMISRQTENDMDKSERRIHFAAMSATGLLGLTSLISRRSGREYARPAPRSGLRGDRRRATSAWHCQSSPAGIHQRIALARLTPNRSAAWPRDRPPDTAATTRSHRSRDSVRDDIQAGLQSRPSS